MTLDTASPLEILWTGISVLGAIAAIWMLVFSTRVCWRVLHGTPEPGERRQAIEEIGSDIRDTFVLLVFTTLGIRAMTVPAPSGGTAGPWPLALAGMFIAANGAIGFLCWLRWRRRRQ